MIPGPDLLLSCSSCDRYGIRSTLASGNTFGAILWTDGKVEAPMLPDNTRFEYWYCEQCETFQRVSAMEVVDQKEGGKIERKDLRKQWQKAPAMVEPSWEQYLKGIKQWEQRLSTRPDWETELRMLTWRRYNDIYREKLHGNNNSWGNLLLNKGKEEQSIEVPRIPPMIDNCNTVATWLYEGNPDKAIDKADILRWLGRYELALQLLHATSKLNEYEPGFHASRHTTLLSRSQDRDSSLCIVPSQN